MNQRNIRFIREDYLNEIMNRTRIEHIEKIEKMIL